MPHTKSEHHLKPRPLSPEEVVQCGSQSGDTRSRSFGVVIHVSLSAQLFERMLQEVLGFEVVGSSENLDFWPLAPRSSKSSGSHLMQETSQLCLSKKR